jgi:hypothetical protein
LKQVKKFDPLSKSFVIVEVSNNEVIKELKTTQPQKLPLSPIIEEKKPKNKSVKSQHQRELDIIKLKTNELLTMSNPSEKTLRQTISYINKFYSSELQYYQKKLQSK